MNNKAVVFAAVSGIEESVVKRFLDINRYYAPWYIDVKVHMSEPTESPYNLAKAMNDGVREYHKDYEVIMKTDVDMLLSPHLMIAAYERTRIRGFALRSWLRYCEEDDPLIRNPENIPWPSVAGLKPKECNGCFMSMNSSTWLKSGGYPECCIGWGGEDNAFVEKVSGMFKMDIAKLYPILHINHEQREWKTSLPANTANRNYKRALAHKNRNWFKRPLTDKERHDILG
jgi:predicted glycosyltransferase involved in capsule biosynthesis